MAPVLPTPVIVAVARQVAAEQDATDDYTFTGYNTADPSWTPKVRPSNSWPTPTPIPSPKPVSHKPTTLSIVSIVLWSVALVCLLLSIGFIVYAYVKRRRARKTDPYADTPMPTLDRDGRWGMTGGSKETSDMRGRWKRLEDESEPLTADMSSPEHSPEPKERKLSDLDMEYRK